jgi:adenylate cyclase class 2
MAPQKEIEIKLEVHDPTALKRRLRQLGFRVVKPRHFESNSLLDFPGSPLRKARCLLRLRALNGRAVLTFKGTPISSGRYKVRPEIETQVADGDGMAQIFERLGLRETFRYEKYRTVLVPSLPEDAKFAAELVYDETPIGNYIELEGPKRWIDRVAKQLGYSRADYINRSYATLYFLRCRERRIKPGNMVFANRQPGAPPRRRSAEKIRN